MQTYLCSRCKQKVARADILSHRKACGVHSDLALEAGWKGKFGTGFKLIFFGLLAAGFCALSLFLGSRSFQSLANMRQLERVPPTTVRAALKGEINLNGTAEKLDSLLHSPHESVPCVYYRYVVERREKDSDGDTTWRTITDEKNFVPFLLKDSTGLIRLNPVDRVDFSVNESWSDRRGDYRYTEYRIEPGDVLFVFGYAARAGSEFQVGFTADGHYQPIISEKGETRERSAMAGGSIALCWFGLVFLAVALSILISMFRVHRLLVYFTLLNILVALYLVVLGLNMMKSDLQAAVARLETHSQITQEEIQSSLQAIGVSWSGDWSGLPVFSTFRPQGLSPELERRLHELRLNLARSVDRVRLQRAAFPEWMLAPLWGIAKPEQLPLPENQRAELDQLGTAPEKAKVPPLLGLIIIGVSGAVAIITFIFGFRKISFKRCMENLPTTPTSGAAYGLSEFKGVVDIAASADYLRGPLSSQPCVQYHYTIKEKRGSGKKSKWVTVLDQHQRIPFLCKDGDGEILVDPAGSTIYSTHRTHKSSGRRRYEETRLELGDPLYAIGECTLEPARGDRLYLRKPEGKYPFILSNFTENQVMLKIARFGILLLDTSFAGILLMALILFGLSGSFAATDYLAAALAAPFFMTAVTLMLHYNDLIFLRERVRRNRSNIDVSLKKRHDLVPQLEQVTQGVMTHEREVQEAVTSMRNLYGANVAKDAGAVNDHMQAQHAALDKLLVLSEDYPELISNTQSALLMRTLITLENEISLMRNGYNDAVETYNTRIESIPDVFFAKMFHFSSEPLIFAETEVVRIPPRIQDIWEKENLPAPKEETESGTEETEEVDKQIEPESTSPASMTALVAAAGDNGSQSVASDDLDTFFELVGSDPGDPLAGLREAESYFPRIRDLSPAEYRGFKQKLLDKMEEDSVITIFEYALQKSVSHNLDPAFGLKIERPIRHRNLSTLIDPVSQLLSLLAAWEESPETVEAAFAVGVKILNHRPLDDFKRRQVDTVNLADFDVVLEEIAHAAPMVRSNVCYACEALVAMNDDATPKQILLLYAIADILDRERPDWAN
jgi:hypothetical protein